MEYLTTNLTTGRSRRAKYNGRDYIVAPLSLIVPGVLPGSKGPLYYPPDEVSRNASIWDTIPLTAYHPKHPSGRHVSANDPGVLERQGIGMVRHSRYAPNKAGIHRLGAEGWFDVEATKRIEPRIYAALMQHQPIELSTGLFTQSDPTPGIHNGISYDYVARDYRPDHVAVLPDQVGACSLNDGCGVLVNQSTGWVDIANGAQTSPAKKCKCKGKGDNCKCKACSSRDMMKSPKSESNWKNVTSKSNY